MSLGNFFILIQLISNSDKASTDESIKTVTAVRHVYFHSSKERSVFLASTIFIWQNIYLVKKFNA